MRQYLDLLNKVAREGTYKSPSRSGMPGSLSIFGYQFRHSLSEGFPLLTTKQVSFKNVVVELLWFLKGDTNIKYLVDNGCNIWNEDAYNYYKKFIAEKIREKDNINYFLLYCEDDGSFRDYSFEEFVDIIKRIDRESLYKQDNYTLGDCGEQYGKLWREWKGHKSFYIDQIRELVAGLQNNPESRRHIITAWNPSLLDKMALPACHSFVQFNCRPLTKEEQEKYKQEDKTLPPPKYYLDCQLYQRSADVFLGVPYNIASYSLLIHIISKMCNFVPGEFIHTFGDVHLYNNHSSACEEQLKREEGSLPTLKISKTAQEQLKKVFLYRNSMMEDYLNQFIDNVSPSDFEVEGYVAQKRINAKLSTGLK